MKQLQLAVTGFGTVGKACAAAIVEDGQLSLAGIVRRPESLTEKFPARLSHVPVVSHARELVRIDAALICVPTLEVLPTARRYEPDYWNRAGVFGSQGSVGDL